MAIQDSIFRTYDIRGIVGSELDLDEVYDLGRAFAAYFKDKNPSMTTIAIGMDGRTSSESIKNDICRALQDQGLDVIFIGVCPSPVLYFALYTLPVQAGIMITASHNPADYNGFKVCLGTHAVWGDQLQEIKKIYRQLRPYPSTSSGRAEEKELPLALSLSKSASDKGSYSNQDMIKPYIDYLADQFAHLKGMKPKIIFDCANGAAGTVMPELVKAMDWPNAELLFPEVDGNYPNHEADPTVRKNMEDLYQAVQKQEAAFGIGFDGDGDRMSAITSTGKLILGDQMLALFANAMKKYHPNMGVVFDIKASMGLIELLNEWGMKDYMVPCGHSYVKEKMDETGALLGGELSCHFCFSDRYFGFDDGIYAALRLLEIVQQSGESLDQLLSIFPHKVSSPELRIPCKRDVSEQIMDLVRRTFTDQPNVTIMDIDGPRVQFHNGWANVRASNTQPVLSVRFEGETDKDLQQIKDDFFTLMKPFIDEKVLRSHFV